MNELKIESGWILKEGQSFNCPPSWYVTTTIYKLLEWEEIPKLQQLANYWLVVPKNAASILDGADYEIIYVAFDGRFVAIRPGERYSSVNDFLFAAYLDTSTMSFKEI